MNGNWMKALTVISCWLLIVCGFPHHANGAEYAATLDGILRSVAAVRAHLESVPKNLFAQRTTELPTVLRVTTVVTGGNRRPSVVVKFRKQHPASILAPVLTIPAEPNVGVTKSVAPDTTAVEPVYRTTWSTTPRSRPVEIIRPSIQLITTPAIPTDDERLRANPLGVIIPGPDQLNYFQQWQVQPNLGQSNPSPQPPPTSTARGPQVADFYFPVDAEEDPNAGQSALDPVIRLSAMEGSTSSTATPFSSVANANNVLPSSTVTVDPVEAETTEPPEEEEGLGNRIDQKVLLSLIG